jgi:chromosome segregation protein
VRLKKLEIHGFKTFASRAVLEFAPGITAVVGPNGSGKSNIADSVRWVLGEQSLRLLRGRKSEDVIFAGGTGRAPMGMVEVTLILDNADGALPAEYAEVSISRRAYRSGENEYYINRSRVRLRDVVDLLSRAGLGQNGYSVVGQGMVDLALSLRPDERRALFEDAAGMRRYHAKRAEAESRLAEVAANTTRVADLIAELAPRVTQLQRQARRAQDEARLRQQWREAHLALLAHLRWEIEQGLAQQTPEAERLALEQQSALADAATGGAALVSAQSQLTAARAAVGAEQRERGRVREALELARREGAIAAERHTAAARSLAEIEASVSRLQARAAEAERATPAAERAREAAQVTLQQTRQALHEANRALQASVIAGEGKNGSQALAQARAVQVDRARQLTQTTTQLRETERRLNEVSKQAAESGDGLQRAEEGLRDLQIRFKTVEDALAEAQKRQTDLQAKTAAAGTARDSAARRVQELAKSVDQKDRDSQAMRVRLSVLRDVTRSATKEGRGGGGERKPSPHPTLAEYLVVPADFEAAVAAVMGTALQWVLVESQDEAASLALEHARCAGRRTTFIAKEALHQGAEPPFPPLPEHQGGLGFLSESVPQENGLDPNKTLLAQSYLVGDLPAALALAAKLQGHRRPSIVTLAGEIVDQIGAITTGSPPDEAGTLRRLREIRECEASLAALEASRQPVLEALTNARQEHAGCQQVERELETEIRSTLQEVSRLSGEQRGLGQQRLRQEKDQRWWAEFAERASSQVSELKDRLGWLDQQRRWSEQAHQQAEEVVRQLARSEEERQTQLATLRERVNAAQVAEAIAAQRLDQATRNFTLATQTASAAAKELDEARRRLTEGREGSRVLHEKAGRAVSVVKEQETLLSQVNERVGDLQATVQSLETAVELHRTEVEQAQRRATQAERAAALLERQRAMLVERLRALEEQADRDVGELPPGASHAAGGDALRTKIESLNTRLRNLGPVNQVAVQEHQEISERLQFMREQLADLDDASASLKEVRAELDAGLERDFGSTFKTVAEHFRVFFRRLFGGGDAQLLLTDPADLGNTGVEIVAQLPGKRRQELASLSGGERALVAVSLLFALLKTRPSPFCVLDEVDAALDEANVGRFCDTLLDLSNRTQFVLVTHNRATMERAGALYGVTLGSDSVSRIVSLRLHDVLPPGDLPVEHPQPAFPVTASRVNS